MLLKTYYTRFLFFFVLYLAINLLIIKFKSNDYIYKHILNILKNQQLILEKHQEKFAVKDKLPTVVSPILRKREKIIDINVKDNQRLMKQVLETCSENNLTTSATRKNFLYSSQHNALYCWIRKVGSTSFTKIFSELNNRLVARNYYKEIDYLSPKTEILLKDLINDLHVFKFLIVRHPFERLVSAYRDRIEDNSKYTAQSWIYAPKIFHLTRPELFQSYGRVDNSLLKIFYENKRLKLIPSFKEFIKWLLQQNSTKDDPYWNQYYKHCALCSVKYDYILKLDNYTNTETDYIFKRINLNKNKKKLSKLGSTRKGHTDFDETCNYFKNLSHEAVVNLYEKYKIDFEMFNYEFDKYFECTEGD